MREQLSFEPAGVIAAAAEPEHGQAFVYLSPRMGGQNAALLLQRAPGQAAVALTDGSFRDGPALWAHDGTRIVFSSNRAAGAPGRERDLELLDTSWAGTPLRVLATGTGWRWRALDWSLDDRRLLLARESVGSEAEPELFLADVATAELTALALPRKPDSKGPAPAPTPLRAQAARFAPDGRGLLLLTAEGAGADFLQLRYLDPVGGELRVLSSDSEHDVELFDESADGRFLAYTINEGGSSRLTLVDQQRKLDLNPGSLPPGIISSLKFDATGKRLALTLESARSPRDVYVLEPETQTLTRWSASEPGPIDAASLVMPALVHFPTWDRIDGQARMLSAYAYRPAAATASAAARPVLILLRSGGGRQFRPGYDPFVQYLVNELGFVVLAPNVRGAGGFGRGFGELGRGALRDDAARDVGSLLVWIGLQHELDHNRVMLMGEGYGSYLALSCLGQYGDRLRGGIAAFPPHLEPLANLAAIRQPVLIVHGRSDPDAPAYEAEQLAARLRVNGAQVQYLGAADEAGEFLRQSNRDAYYSAAANFLAQLLR
jgi:dipeptidyl aminopeptidase/acylaminoacyl peptidase